ncbi:hypothetical protein A2Z33_02335 [Candidatus Gottesmanbacteria bacterium RBG_16_52_11]|uniref:Small ribosomal subunit protein bS20 n=1 Tax=Candidatus Gottesmanbacteria bacterium RBG_16_52_11 TaxID=1798374 RepID=A0A1F5YMN1_9BACT|nr:MAG: hypothetical protein A2Z33_02335 [Candidatus Gottesmanbacteria bacterium RBG_16_52_11]
MPIIARAVKKLRHDRKTTAHNARLREMLRTAVKTARKSPSKKNLSNAFKNLDKGVKTGIIHRNKSARLKSRLAVLLAK